MATADIGPLLESEAAKAGIALPGHALEPLRRHYALLVKWNRAVRLVGSTDAETVVRRHILESLALLPYLHEPAGSLLDIGSGNGFPAIPIKCVLPSLRLAMMEPTQRKSAFLRTAARELGLADTEVIRDRLDRPADLARYGRWDCITMRAVAAIPALLSGAPAALRPTGRILLLVGDSGRKETLKLAVPPLHVIADTLLPGASASFAVVIELQPPGGNQPPCGNVPRGTITSHQAGR